MDPSKTLVLAVHDAGGMESPDFQVGVHSWAYVRVACWVQLCMLGSAVGLYAVVVPYRLDSTARVARHGAYKV